MSRDRTARVLGERGYGSLRGVARQTYDSIDPFEDSPVRRDVLLAIWRMFVIWTFAFWQGGFLFYASVVVPTAQFEIGHRRQGFITRQVTEWLNEAGALSLIVLAIDYVVSRDPRPSRRTILWVVWLGMAVCQGALFLMHPMLDAMLDLETLDVADDFRPLHRIYLWTHTVQWALAVVATIFQMAAWRRSDRAATDGNPS